MKLKRILRSYATAVILASHNVFSFAPSKYLPKSALKFPITLLKVGENDSEDSFRSDLDEMRKILEESWDVNTMSHIPTNVESGAKAATEAIINVLNDSDRNEPKVIMIDIALPSYDPNFGSFYDDVGAAEFCCEIANGISAQRESTKYLSNDGQVAIVVKDGNLVSRLERVLGTDDDIDDSTVEEYDDFSDFVLPSMNNNPEDSPNYRIGSFLGNTDTIPSGRNMINDLCKLVSQNAIPVANANDEDVIIMSCPVSQAELVGVRWLVSKYGSSKTIIIVNNRLNPLPQELLGAETVYSVLPLIARSVGSAPAADKPANPKIVLMRRYPHDWQIYVDDSTGPGFELASSVPVQSVGVRGPSMDFISERVKEYMTEKTK
jgi:hypothetical protein